MRRGGLLALAIAVVLTVSASSVEALDVYFINVGAADAILIDCGDWEALLDAGRGYLAMNAAILAVLEEHVDDGILELAILSHPHADHYGGFEAVFGQYEVCEFWRSRDAEPDNSGPTYSCFLSALAAEGLVPRQLECGDCFVSGQIEWTVLGPDALITSPRDENDNENSLVLLLTFGAVSFFFPGDIESIPDGAAGNWVVPLAPSVLKAPHHGRTHSATLALTEWLTPDLVVVSTGDCVPETGAAMTQLGILFLSTSTCGTIHIRTDGESVWVTTDTLSAQVVDCTD